MGATTAKTTIPAWTGEEVTKEELFKCLTKKGLAGRNIQDTLRRIGVDKAATLNKVVGAGYMWKPFGQNQSNISTIGLGTKPGRALAERITNAQDAVFEAAKPRGKKTPTSPREAAKEWFGRPETGPESGLYQIKYSPLDAAITVHIRGNDTKHPTIDIEDRGIGIEPEDFEKTILSLQAGNKITKWYLAGTFGQGGSASLAFAKYTVIWSRHRDNLPVTGFTVIRELELGGEYKENCYAYLADEKGDILYIDTPEGADGHGTTVRHVEYKLEGLDGTLISSPGNLYHYLNYSMFDPLLPFRVVDHRDFKRDRNEVISGARNRLMKGTLKGPREEGSDIVHHHPMEFLMVGDTMKEPALGLEYWVVFSRRKSGLKDGKILLRPQSNELFVTNNYPIVATVNGQVHGDLSAKFLRDMGLPLVSKHIVIHLDASRMPAKLRRELFSTTREGFKEGPLLTEVQEKLRSVLEDDEKLFDLEQQLADKIVSSENVHTSSEVKAQVVKFLSDAGFHASTVGPRKVKGHGKELDKALGVSSGPGEGGEGAGNGEAVSEEPWISAPFPEVHEFRAKVDAIEVPQGRTRVVVIESDASREFADRQLVALRSEPDYLDIVSFTAPKHGGFQWRVKAKDDVAVGATAVLVATITKPNGEQITAEVLAQVTEAPVESGEEGFDRIPQFEIMPVSPRDAESWSMVWPELPPDSTPEKDLAKVAYRPLKVGDSLFVYYSSVNEHFAEVMEKYAHRGPLRNAFQTEYEIYTAFHAILQHLDPPEYEGITPEIADKLMEEERSRVAKMQVKESLRLASIRLQAEKAMRQGGGE